MKGGRDKITLRPLKGCGGLYKEENTEQAKGCGCSCCPQLKPTIKQGIEIVNIIPGPVTSVWHCAINYLKIGTSRRKQAEGGRYRRGQGVNVEILLLKWFGQ
jgi:hypothetical protein